MGGFLPLKMKEIQIQLYATGIVLLFAIGTLSATLIKFTNDVATRGTEINYSLDSLQFAVDSVHTDIQTLKYIRYE